MLLLASSGPTNLALASCSWHPWGEGFLHVRSKKTCMPSGALHSNPASNLSLRPGETVDKDTAFLPSGFAHRLRVLLASARKAQLFDPGTPDKRRQAKANCSFDSPSESEEVPRFQSCESRWFFALGSGSEAHSPPSRDLVFQGFGRPLPNHSRQCLGGRGRRSKLAPLL